MFSCLRAALGLEYLMIIFDNIVFTLREGVLRYRLASYDNQTLFSSNKVVELI
jgi:hypothetical protein